MLTSIRGVETEDGVSIVHRLNSDEDVSMIVEMDENAAPIAAPPADGPDGDEDTNDAEPGPSSSSSIAAPSAPAAAPEASWDTLPEGAGVGDLFYAFEDSEEEQESVCVKVEGQASAEPSPAPSNAGSGCKRLLPEPTSWSARAPARPLSNIEARLAASRAKLQSQLLQLGRGISGQGAGGGGVGVGGLEWGGGWVETHMIAWFSLCVTNILNCIVI